MQLKENALYLVAGDDVAVTGGLHGLYLRDTRHLSRLEWIVDGRPLAGPARETQPYAFAQDGRTGALSAIAYRDELDVPAGQRVELIVDCDFRDLFELRGLPAIERTVEVDSENAAVVYRYRGADGVRRSTRITVAPPPDADEPEGAGTARTMRWDAAAQITVTVEVATDPADPSATVSLPTYAEWRRSPVPAGADDSVRRVLDRAADDLRTLLFVADEETYLAAGVPYYVSVFGRDALWSALFTLPSYPRLARDTLSYLARHQGSRFDSRTREAPGKILHERREGEAARTGRVPYRTYYGSIDSTPLWICLLDAYTAATGDLDLARRLAPHLHRALEWMGGPDADPDQDGFLEYVPDPAGLVNQTWKDSADSVFDEAGADLTAPIAAVEVQAYAYRAYAGASRVLGLLGEDGVARECALAADRLRAAFGAFWLPELGTYAHALDAAKRPARVPTSNAGHALWAGIVPRPEAARLADTLLDGPMWSGWGVRTLSAGAPRYDPVSYHNGSIWPHDNAIIATGLHAYGFVAQARRLGEAQLDAARLAPDARLPELYSGASRDAAAPAVQPYPSACRPQAWSAAAVFAFVRAGAG
jgi:glycogen debranching enzyme